MAAKTRKKVQRKKTSRKSAVLPAKRRRPAHAPADREAVDWPQPRNIFFRPESMQYVRKMLKPSGCVFCRSAGEPFSLETLCVYKTEHSQIVLNKYPYNNGHLLILPLDHIGNILQLSAEKYEDLQRTLRLGIQAVQDIYAPNGMNIGLNHGPSSGAGIPDHLHYHIVPRWNGDLNFFPLIAGTKLVLETLDQTYDKFSHYFTTLRSDR